MFSHYLEDQQSKDDPEPKQTPPFAVIQYNAWESDYWDEPFAPFMQAILESKYFKGSDYKNVFARILNSVIQTSEAKPAKVYSHYRQSSPLFQFSQKQKAIRELKTCFQEMLEVYKNTSLKKVVIIIDELDRCKPLFAIQTLEIVKHFLDVKDVVFIFAVDLEQLSHSIESVYGSGIDASGYLCKFFDYITKFPKVSEKFLVNQFLYESTQLVFSSEQNISDFIRLFADMSDCFALSLRDIETILQNYKIMLNSFLGEYVTIEAHKLYLFLLVIKYKKSEDFNSIFYRTGQDFSDEIKRFFRKHRGFENLTNLIRSHKPATIHVNDTEINLSSLTYDSETHKLSGRSSRSPHITTCITISPHFSTSNLFYPDFANEQNLNYLKSLNYSEYILRHLENFNFSTYIQDAEQ